jgi:hypothetical protein
MGFAAEEQKSRLMPTEPLPSPTLYFDVIDQQDARTLGQIDREKVASPCKLGPAVSHTIILPASVGVRFAHSNLHGLVIARRAIA